MKRAITVVSVCLGIAVAGAPVAAVADGGRGAVAKACAKLKKADRGAFRATYGKRPMRHCIKGDPIAVTETTPVEFKNAAKECRAERELDPAGLRGDLRDERQPAQRVRQVRLEQGPRSVRRNPLAPDKRPQAGVSV